MARETILVVDDDEDIREIICMYLLNEGYKIFSAKNGKEALEIAQEKTPDLVILDMMLPDLDGIEVCQELRKNTTVPIVFLSCKSTPGDKTIGLIAGGDDYMGKPFDANELLARVKAHLRRNRIIEGITNTKTPGKTISYLGLKIDLDRYYVSVNEEEVLLSPKEFQLFVFLAKHPNKVFTNEQLYKLIWDTESFGDYRTLMVHISNIRKKIEPDPKNPTFIITVKGVGYKFYDI